jgi:hypothetical protein
VKTLDSSPTEESSPSPFFPTPENKENSPEENSNSNSDGGGTGGRDADVKASIPHPLEDITFQGHMQRNRNPSGDACLIKSISLPVEPTMRSRALSTGHYPRNQVLETNVSVSV